MTKQKKNILKDKTISWNIKKIIKSKLYIKEEDSSKTYRG